ncbi:MAG: UPF0182 family protein, partial [Cyanobacteria bacterium J06576_12]
LIDGRFKWILDGYTTSDRYPYSEPLALSRNVDMLRASEPQLNSIVETGINYIRDAAKVVIDAYDGTLTVYALGQDDPVLTTYQKIFPDLFTPISDASDELSDHFRYPLNLFQLQAQMYRAYHMNDIDLFYNQEDLWQLPQQIGENDQPEQMQPYYVIMRLPNAESEEFLQILPFTPARKDNMVAWMAARCDGDQYGQLVLYEFPKQVLVYGPQQIEARIDQDTDISGQLTLWNQQGSSVIRGNLLVIPVDQSLLYFEPVYLEADNGAFPELKRVIVSFKDTIVMRNTLPEALEAIFKTSDSTATPTTAASPKPNADAGQLNSNTETSNLVQEAIKAYEEGEKALQSGDWAAYGQAQQRLGALLQQLNRDPAASSKPTLEAKPTEESKPTSEPDS